MRRDARQSNDRAAKAAAGAKAEYCVIKNTWSSAPRLVRSSPMQKIIKGPTGLVIGYDDPGFAGENFARFYSGRKAI